MPTAQTRPLGALYPTQLLHFRRCQLSWRLRYVDQQPFHEQPSPALALGNAVHETLAALLRQPVGIRSEIDPQAIQHLVADRLRIKGVHAEDALEVAAVEGREAVRFCLDQLDDDIEILGVERTLRYRSRALDRFGATLAARIDLLVRHPDGEIETYDWNTGRDDNEEDAF